MPGRMLLLIRSLSVGGSERQLVLLAKGIHERGVDVSVATFYSGGALERELHAAGLPVVNLGKRGRWDLLPFFWRVVKTIRRRKPTVLYTFLPTANVVGVLARTFARVPQVVWGIRASDMDLGRYDWLSRLERVVSVQLARAADLIVCNSSAGREYHARLGYPAEKMRVIPNGIDTSVYRFEHESRARVRAAWGIEEGELTIGIVARLDPMKGYETFLEAAELLAGTLQRVRFVAIGAGTGPYAAQLRAQAEATGLGPQLLWVGEQEDTQILYSGMDIVCSASVSEGFSNAIAEAMACERVCAVTDVGDSASIVGGTGIVVRAGDARALAGACAQIAAMSETERRALGKRARARIHEHFAVSRMIDRTGWLLGLWPEPPMQADS